MDFPRLQLLLISTVLLAAHIVLLDFELPMTWVLVVVTFGCMFWHAWWILPYTKIWPKEVRGSTDSDPSLSISILTANVLTPNRNSEALLELVSKLKPDILATLESNDWWQVRLDSLEEEMPYSVKCPQDNLYGMHVYSRLPLSDIEVSNLVEEDVPSIHTLVTLRNGVCIGLHVLHPAPPSPTENNESIERDAELVLVARSTAESELPTIVAGDLNDVAWSSTTRLFRKISGLLDPRIGRGLFNTFHAGYPLVRWPLDHLFHSPHFTVSSIKRLPPIGSDHFPLYATLKLDGKPESNSLGLESAATDRARADSIVRQPSDRPADVPTPGE